MRSFRHQRQSGFTLIELIIVIVIIGILAAIAIPKFQDLTNDARQGIAYGVAGSAASASAVNYARRKGNTGGAQVASCTALETANLVDKPTNYTVVGGNLNNDGTTAPCSIAFDGVNIANTTFQAYGAP